jgi:uncharacterized protein (TIGR00369 family)
LSNPDIALVRAFIAAPHAPVTVDSNPLAMALGARLTDFDPSRRELTMHCAPEALFRQGAGFIQGGALSAMLDFAMAFAGFAAIGDDASVSTVTMNVAFQKAATARGYDVRGRIDKHGRRIMFASAEVSADGAVLATATSTLLVVPAKG